MERGAISPSLPTRVRKGRSLGEADEPQGRQSPDFPQYWEAAAINKDGRAWGRRLGKGRGRRKGAVQFSVLGLAVESERRGKTEMWLKGTEEGAATRVMSACACALGFALSYV